ncbi:MAG: polysaccharide biosynthesis/export family protein [Pyrinomonadaceae bacterium]
MRARKILLPAAVMCLTAVPFARAQQEQKPIPPQPQTGVESSATAAVPTRTISSDATTLGMPLSERREYTLGPGDAIELKVFGEPQMDGTYDVDGDGNLSVPFAEAPIAAKCRTINQVRKDVVNLLSQFLRRPQVYMRVRELKSRPPAVVYGAVRSVGKFEMHRPARLLELLSNSGGVTEQNNGTIQITHTVPDICAETGTAAGPQSAATTTDALGIPYEIYRVSDLKAGKTEANPYVRPGDIIYVAEASPIYMTGSVIAPQGIYLRENLTLSTAMAMVGGPRPEAKTSKIKIYRLKPDGIGREELVADYKAIKNNKQSDILLQAYDVVEVGDSGPLSKGNLFKTITSLVTGGAQSLVTNAPLRVIY